MYFVIHGVVLVTLFEVVLGVDVHIYVSPTGLDTNNGLDIQHPLRTLQKAKQLFDQNSMRGKNVYVELLAGYHDLPSSLHFNSHAYPHPVTIRAYQGQEVHVTGGRRIATNSFKDVTDQTILKQWTPAAQKHIKQVHLPDVGITNYGQISPYGWYIHRKASLEIFINGQPLTLARYPNTGYIDITAASNITNTEFTYSSSRDAKWANEKEPWAYGYWYWGWSDYALKISNIDAKSHTITLQAKPPHGIRPGQFVSADMNLHGNQGGYFRVFNMLSELDQPGEYFLDRSTGILYLWPNTKTGTLTSSDIVYASMLDDCITMDRWVQNVVFEDFTLEACRRYGFNANNAHHLTLNKMELKNTGSFGFHCGIDCRNISITRCEIHDGDGGIDIEGGNRPKLEPSGNIIENNHIWAYAREGAVGQDAIHAKGVNTLIRYNHIHDGQYAGILYEGNDHVMEYNHLHHLCVTTSDCGAIHATRSWTHRGNVIRYNHIHHTLRFVPGAASRGVMLDDLYSSVLIEHNVFYENEIHVNIGGGRDNIVRYNIMYNATAESMQVDARGLSPVFKYVVRRLRNEIAKLPVFTGVWKMKYPEMATLKNGTDILPEGNKIYDNIVWNPKGINTFLYSDFNYAKPKYFDAHDNHGVQKLQDFTAPSYHDFTPRCATKQWADSNNFVTPISIRDVGPRYTTGPTYLHTVLPSYLLGPTPTPCDMSTVAPATTSPGTPYLSDGSGSNTLYPQLTVGCWMIASFCPKHPELVGAHRDLEGEQHFGAGTDEEKCLSRAKKRWLDCNAGPNHYVQAVFGPTGAMTLAGSRCYSVWQACPKHPAGPGIHIDGYAENHNASHIEEACLVRAHDYWTYCGSDPRYPATSIFGPTGNKRTCGAGCWIKVTSCPADPKLGTFFYDAWGATNVHSDEYEDECYERGTYYWQHCGSHTEFPVTAYFRPLAKHSVIPGSVTTCPTCNLIG